MKTKIIEKKKVIFDTDLFNEADDQFALAYLLKNREIFDLEAITISPFKHSKYTKSLAESIEDSYNEAWFEYMNISCPFINGDNTFTHTENRHTIKFVKYLDANKIIDNLYDSLLKLKFKYILN